MRPILLSSVAALLCAGTSQVYGSEAAASTPAKPAASAPTVAEVKAPTTQQQKLTRCNVEASAKKLTGDALKNFVVACLKAN